MVALDTLSHVCSACEVSMSFIVLSKVTPKKKKNSESSSHEPQALERAVPGFRMVVAPSSKKTDSKS